MKLYAFAVSFLIAFLLFAVQPMTTRMVLPTLGGTPAVWNTVMFTFQALLLAGYLYAHALATRGKNTQMLIHTSLCIAACALLPLSVSLPADAQLLEQPVWVLIRSFVMQVGLPFLCLSATAPLLQAWVSRSMHPLAKTPYQLYSASNLGSFCGLLGYALAVEPLLDLNQQRMAWSGLFIGGSALLLLLGWMLKQAPTTAQTTEVATPIANRQHLAWIGLAFLPSSLNLGVTTYITTDIVSIPLFWVVPLAIYLLSYVDAFSARPRFVPSAQRLSPAFALTGLCIYALQGNGLSISYVLHLVIFAVLAFAIHGMLAQRRPAVQHLTSFYVCLSIGGMLGGLFNGLAAPLLFTHALEYPLVLVAATVVTFVALHPSTPWRAHARAVVLCLIAQLGTLALYKGLSTTPSVTTMLAVLAAAALVVFLTRRTTLYAFYAALTFACTLLMVETGNGKEGRQLLIARNFFGVTRVYENTEMKLHLLQHGTTLHGMQSLDPAQATKPLSYYVALQEVFKALPVTHRHPAAVIGLGIGTVKCYLHPRQQMDLFEIDPMMKKLAETPEYFTYLRDCPGTHRIIMGDGRVGMAATPPDHYGILIIDAFTSDSIPTHLLTREAMAVYLEKLAPEGVIAIHISNRHINLRPLLGAVTKDLGVYATQKFFHPAGNDPRVVAANWVVISKGPATIKRLETYSTGWKDPGGEGYRPWTDQYINLFPYLHALHKDAAN